MHKLHGQFYTYVHCNEHNIPFYVGKGKGDRAWHTGRGKMWRDYVKKHPFIPENVRIYKVDSEEVAFSLEKELIWLLREEMSLWLANATDGGEGSAGYKFDKIDVERRAKLQSEAMMGHEVSQVTRDKLSVALTGHKRSEESVLKSIKGCTGQKRTPEQCANIKAGNPGLKSGEHAQAAIAARRFNTASLPTDYKPSPICLSEGCGMPSRSRSLCRRHYFRFLEEMREKRRQISL